jgi:hypothetical protein
MSISREILLRMGNVSDKSYRENQNTRFMFSNFFRKWCPLRDNVEKFDGARGATNDVTIRHIRVAHWISKATCTHAHAHAHAAGHMHAHTQIRNTYCFSTATVGT